MKKAGIYIHFPFCKVKCMYCDFLSLENREKDIPKFIQMLIREIELAGRNFNEDWIFDSIFFGGGTPSLIEPKWMEEILNTLKTYFNLYKVKEITLEANPGEAPIDRLAEFYSLGINRLSIGFQSLQNNLLSLLSRIHSSNDCFNLSKWNRCRV